MAKQMKVGDLVKVNDELHLISNINNESVISFPEKGVKYISLQKVITSYNICENENEFLYTKITKHKGKYMSVFCHKEGTLYLDEAVTFTKV